MAKKGKKAESSEEIYEYAGKSWREGELIDVFKLTRITDYATPSLEDWMDVQTPELNLAEQFIFDKTFVKGRRRIAGWSEEDLKMKFISHILELGHFDDDDIAIGFFDKTISATVDGIKLSVKSDFMLAKGILDVFRTPYFHFQEYKPYKNPSGDSMAQLLESFLIAQEMNKNGNPMYGIDIMGANWRFVIMEGRTYCISKAFDITDKEDLLKIISMLRKFRWILETRLAA